jgi:hypothetical protein
MLRAVSRREVAVWALFAALMGWLVVCAAFAFAAT